jgi:hypothetical protein
VISAMRMGGGRGGPCFHMGTGVAWEIPSHMDDGTDDVDMVSSRFYVDYR